VGIVAAAVVIAVAVEWVLWHGRAPAPAAPPTPPDPRLAYTGPFLNVRPNVGYVGDDRCAECHADISASYHKHPMARSLTPIAQLASKQFYDAALHNPFEAFGSRFWVERQGGAVHHRRTRLDGEGRPIFEADFEVDYAIGSGVHGYSYLTDRDGCLFQTPISWYEQKHTWGLSPQFSLDHLPGRPVGVSCLFCHANRTRPVPGSVNRFEEPLIEGDVYGIGCERCHGPGELHVRNHSPDSVDHIDHTIVNPARLAPPLREAVCEQCHLEGASRIIRRGRDFYDFRPGLPLEGFLAVFVRPAGGGADRKAVNHVEQMYQSGCFRGGTAEDRIGCISCHDPHDHVGPERRVAHYREACLNCHESKLSGCNLPVAQRRLTSPDDSCIQCHMPRYAASDIVHNASTDHRIPRRPNQPDAPEPADAASTLAKLFHPDAVDPRDPDYRRDLGLALAQLSELKSPSQKREAQEADGLLDEAVRNFPNDTAAWTVKGRRALLEGRAADALAAFEASLAVEPDEEGTLNGAAEAERQLGKSDAAAGYWRRSLEISPWSPVVRQGLAELLASQQKWKEAEAIGREWLREAPDKTEAHQLLIRCLLKTGDRAGAEAELKTLKALQPGSDDDLDFWFNRQQR
jgi:Tfp pilus assembly protein PilF